VVDGKYIIERNLECDHLILIFSTVVFIFLRLITGSNLSNQDLIVLILNLRVYYKKAVMSDKSSSIAENIASLNALSSTLTDDTDKTARKNALKLSKALVSQLEEPANVAVELAFSVSLLILLIHLQNI
jgi:hypothetical protein